MKLTEQGLCVISATLKQPRKTVNGKISFRLTQSLCPPITHTLMCQNPQEASAQVLEILSYLCLSSFKR